jgi:hypothetical protein
MSAIQCFDVCHFWRIRQMWPDAISMGLSGLSDLLLFSAMKKNRPRLADFGFVSHARARIFAVRFCNTY